MREVMKFKFSDKEIEEILVPNQLGESVKDALLSILSIAVVSTISTVATGLCRNTQNKAMNDLKESSLQSYRLVRNRNRGN